MQLIRTRSLGSGRHMRGLSLVELMVGIAVSLFVVAAASMLVSMQLSDNRRLLLETQLQQDLRATADIVTRELRRSSYWEGAMNSVPSPAGSSISTNPLRELSVGTSVVNYKYRRGSGAEAFGFRLDTDGVVRACQSDAPSSGGNCSGAWQELTDPNTVRVTRFSVESVRSAAPDNDKFLALPCPQLCADGTTACWPKVAVREFVLTLQGESRSDPAVKRTLTSSVRVRNDRIELSSEAVSGQACPAS